MLSLEKPRSHNFRCIQLLSVRCSDDINTAINLFSISIQINRRCKRSVAQRHLSAARGSALTARKVTVSTTRQLLPPTVVVGHNFMSSFCLSFRNFIASRVNGFVYGNSCKSICGHLYFLFLILL